MSNSIEKQCNAIDQKLETIERKKVPLREEIEILKPQIKELTTTISKSVNLGGDKDERKKRNELRQTKTQKEERLAVLFNKIKTFSEQEKQLLSQRKFLKKGY